jgi:hypothetical protein
MAHLGSIRRLKYSMALSVEVYTNSPKNHSVLAPNGFSGNN